MNIKYTIWKIKSGKLEVWKAWCHELMTTRYEEALITISEENLVHEKCVIFEKEGENYVIYTHGTVEGKAKKKANMDHAVNKKHFKIMKECLEYVYDTGWFAPLNGYELERN
ncbi:MAG: hypothetical protein A3J55_00180 [Candidatus Ryanbacteria bacterium RIFCSPHIGHO2_02_FULL_45_17b]|uniref:Uncharacterized protein n=1 Tax=Candidatus Ryanbacteria bacterium RIFCSPHIGHO2_01_FULL_45_22 TaxID=1802114 RepID=A0A1G2G1V9_9BACT|nr:MAG: hypothetical protein A2719_02645 [Candidatus Ryanbacteria bacterium RIFCSPHIGHO2_01_FULL_45_22]OGZ46965.1 MAG: hypothetical protein A3J55_00180 [Candidatus Ryanbacteria bacterium RIFCSPHIGHO2_02_FULL_45_17b]